MTVHDVYLNVDEADVEKVKIHYEGGKVEFSSIVEADGVFGEREINSFGSECEPDEDGVVDLYLEEPESIAEESRFRRMAYHW